MLTPAEALEIVLGAARVLPSERVDIASALGRVLAEDVCSDIDMPPFDKSAMDGFACRRADLASDLRVIEVITAGCQPQRTIRAGESSKIMTGAMLPRGADCVIMKEQTEEVSGDRVRFTGTATSDNICKRGEDIRGGETVLRIGTLLKAPHIAVLASCGTTEPVVVRRPKVAVLATGSELVPPASKPEASQIRNSNSFQIAAQVEQVGAVAQECGAAKDTIESIDAAFKNAIGDSDVVMVSGGVSEGDLDLVPEVLRRNGAKLLFERIAIKPGKPTVFGLCEKAYCFGLPGNPVSSFVLFELLCKPFLYKLMGHEYKPSEVVLNLDITVGGRNMKRQSWIPVAIMDGRNVRPIEYHGSAHINALCDAQGLMRVDPQAKELKKGTPVTVRLI